MQRENKIKEYALYKDKKFNGRVYTPPFIVSAILDFAGYCGCNILKKHIIDNSCGDGAFLAEIVSRYCREFLKTSGDFGKLKTDLETYIHGIEINKSEAAKCKERLDKISCGRGVKRVKWDLLCANALNVSKFNQRMDFVVGNPPYVRVHNLKENYSDVKKFSFARDGMTDLYLVFFEIGFNMLGPDGRMCLITPSSFFRSKAAGPLREFLYRKRRLLGVIDLGHFQPFSAATYTAITLCGNNGEGTVDYFVYDESANRKIKSETLDYESVFTGGKMYFSSKRNMNLIKNIEKTYRDNSKFLKISVKNGFATLCDSVFIGKIDIKDDYVIDVIKASTGKWTKCVFPYSSDGIPVNESDLKENHGLIYSYLKKYKEKLQKRDIEKNGHWFLFGRSQGVKDVFRNKVAVNSLVKDVKSIKLNEVKAGGGIYGGLYIISQYSFKDIEDIILRDDFIEYVRILKNYKSGGYYTFSSDDLEKFLVYKITKDWKYRGQPSLFENLTKSFRKYLTTSPTSNEKLKIIHGEVASHLERCLNEGRDEFIVRSLGFRDGKERKIAGRYIDKLVDIVVSDKNERPISGMAFKFIMSNYKQNSNNYFESMLGETANVRCRKMPYFQIIILMEELPYYSDGGKIKKFERLSENNLKKYIVLSDDPADTFFHTPSKILVYITKLPELPKNMEIKNREEYKNYYKDKELSNSESFNNIFKDGIILNDYERFMKKVVHYIKSLGS